MTNNIFVYVEKDSDIAFELLGAARNLVKGDAKVCAVCFTEPKEKLARELYEGGADKIYSIEHDKLGEYDCKLYSDALLQLVKKENPSILLIGATYQGRDLAPRISTQLNTGLTADCTQLEIIEQKNEMKLAATRPTFGGQLMATILCKTTPQMATVREHVLKRLDYTYTSAKEFEKFAPNLDNLSSGVRVLEFIENTFKNQNDLENAKIILSGGKGLKKEDFETLEVIVQELNSKGYKAAVGASRPAVDAKLAQQSCQVGQTGKTVSPKLYIAFGISGAIQHLAGMQNSEFVIAINKDSEAPIFKNCDIGIVSDARPILDEMLSTLQTMVQ